MKAYQLPAYFEMVKIPLEKYVVAKMIGDHKVRNWDFLFVAHDSAGLPIEVWGAMYNGDRWNTRWEDREYDPDQTVERLWKNISAEVRS
jgi:hypothetical protein